MINIIKKKKINNIYIYNIFFFNIRLVLQNFIQKWMP